MTTPNDSNNNPTIIINNTSISQNINQTQSGRTVNKVIYCIFAFFYGGFGVHRFYIGKNNSGIVRILFCWTGIPSIMGICAFVVALFKKADENGNIIM